MSNKPDEAAEMQREILMELQRITDRLDMITNYEEKKPSAMYYVGCSVAIVLFFLSTAATNLAMQNQNGSSVVIIAAPFIWIGVFFLMIIMFCQTWKSRRVSPAEQARERDQDRKLAERLKRKDGSVSEPTAAPQRNIQPPF